MPSEILPADTHQTVAEYYGKTLTSSRDLKTNACCTLESVPLHLRPLISQVHEEIRDRYYGCGSPMPPALADCTVLDLGCGSGRDCYVLSQLVGPNGQVIGVDMTPEQLQLARRYQSWHAERFGHDHSNVSFKDGLIEDLSSAGIADASIDVVVSNCVINLSPEKPRVLREIFRVLKAGGELYFSDVFADRRIAAELRADPVLLGECLGGAMYWEDFRRLMQEIGCADVRVVSESAIVVDDPALQQKIGHVRFRSVTVRAFKLDLEDRCEDFGQVAWYQGSIAELPHAFDLDDHHHLETGKPMTVCGNTADMLGRTRYARHFRIAGEKTVHFGLYDCAPGPNAAAATSGACC
ncbi:MAG: methyltransferase type 11 [Lysobacterales bacterium CG02_land_8_20_14_3_00_62_12]|nr:MAG: methyltransferase type 11 [Xanthomonadales bacterium CG02_land_8_20_14_3_00_62_12]PJA41453.1 MAG: methyltransferase type 11 [Xanthomonadales bacterium CG_4_9_14_3_um_filter_62_6]